MRYRRTLLASGLLVATLACACVEHAPGDSSRTDSTSSPIEGGEPINKAGYPTSTQFPQSTVLLTTPFQAPTGLRNRFCTGVILTPTKILTAAHCLVGPTTVVSFYPTTPGGGALPIPKKTVNASPTVPVETQPGVVCDNALAPFPNTCVSTWGPVGAGSGSIHYADLAVLTLASAVPTGYRPALLGASGSFAASQASTTPPPLWSVGAGQIDLFLRGCNPALPGVTNSNHTMMWVPTYHVGEADGGGYSDDDGAIQTSAIFAGHGDSGGPLYQQGPIPDGGAPTGGYNLILVGILSSVSGCFASLPDGGTVSTIGNADLHNTWTSVLQPENHAWIVQQGATVAPMISYGTFGASL